MRHAEILALGRLFREGSSTTLDDRAAAIEIQVEQDLPLREDNFLGAVIPHEYTRVPGLMRALKNLTKYVETYDHLPLGTDHHYGLIYDRVNRIFNRAGIKIES